MKILGLKDDSYFELELGKINIIIGEHCTGKTYILKMIRNFYSNYSEIIDREFLNNFRLYFDKIEVEKIWNNPLFKEILSNFGINIKFKPGYYISDKFQIWDKGYDKYISFRFFNPNPGSVEMLIKLFLFLFYNIETQEKHIIFIDGLEFDFHPTWQRKILPSIVKILNKNCIDYQLNITTTSEIILSSFEDVYQEGDKLFECEIVDGEIKINLKRGYYDYKICRD